MVGPVLGPFYKTRTVFGRTTPLGYTTKTSVRNSACYKQSPPYNLPLPYSMEEVRLIGESHSNPNAYADATSFPGGVVVSNSILADANNKAYANLVQAAHAAQAEMAVSLIELRKTSVMVGNRLLQLAKIVKAVKKRDLKTVVKLLRIDPKYARKKSMKSAIKDIGSFWLEVWWGFKPTIMDVQSGMEVLCQGPTALQRPIKGKGSANSNYSAAPVYTTRPGNGWSVTSTGRNERCQVHTGGILEVENPNKLLLAELGLVNPLSWIWELTPWSAVVDWIGNIGQMINQLSDFYGLTLARPFSTVLKEVQVWSSQNGLTRTYIPGSPDYNNGYIRVDTDHSVYVKRGTNLLRGTSAISPKLRFALPGRVSYTRMATASALLTTFLR